MHSKAEQSKAKLTWQHVARSDACDVGSGWPSAYLSYTIA